MTTREPTSPVCPLVIEDRMLRVHLQTALNLRPLHTLYISRVSE